MILVASRSVFSLFNPDEETFTNQRPVLEEPAGGNLHEPAPVCGDNQLCTGRVGMHAQYGRNGLAKLSIGNSQDCLFATALKFGRCSVWSAHSRLEWASTKSDSLSTRDAVSNARPCFLPGTKALAPGTQSAPKRNRKVTSVAPHISIRKMSRGRSRTLLEFTKQMLAVPLG